jgi:hypothetical protein
MAAAWAAWRQGRRVGRACGVTSVPPMLLRTLEQPCRAGAAAAHAGWRELRQYQGDAGLLQGPAAPRRPKVYCCLPGRVTLACRLAPRGLWTSSGPAARPPRRPGGGGAGHVARGPAVAAAEGGGEGRAGRRWPRRRGGGVGGLSQPAALPGCAPALLLRRAPPSPLAPALQPGCCSACNVRFAAC